MTAAALPGKRPSRLPAGLAARVATAYASGMAPPIPKIPPKYWMYGAAVLFPVVQYAFKAMVSSLAPEPRTCPKCSYRMVDEVARRAAGKERLVHYWRCAACAARYRSFDEGPLASAPPDDWKKHVRFRFYR